MHRIVLTVGTLAIAFALSGCAGMSEQEQRMATGAAIGGVAVGALTGSWAWGAAGAAAGATTGYIVQTQRDSQRQREQAAFERGVREGQSQPHQ